MSSYFKSRPFHPYLYALIPVIDIFVANRSRVSYNDLFFSMALVLSFLALTSLVLRLAIKEAGPRGVLLIVFAVLTFSFKFIYDRIHNWRPLNLFLTAELNLMLTIAVVLSLTFIILRKKEGGLPRLTLFLNIYTILLLSIALFNLSTAESAGNLTFKKAEKNKALSKIFNDNGAERIAPASKNSGQPDIYYIILDTYARADTLKEIYAFDNGPFLKELEDRGFTVSSSSRTNYVFTQLSLASSLNMEPINYLSGFLGSTSKNPSIPNRMIMDNKVMDYLRTKGYKSVIFSTGWGPTKRSDDADAAYDYLPYFADEFNRVLIESTIFRGATRNAMMTISRNRILYNFDKVAEVAEAKEPTFAFAHFILPHQPYLFDKKGGAVALGRFEMGGDVWNYKDAYLEQLIFTNKKVLEMVDEILEKSDEPPIIVIQSDHGPSSTGGWDNPSDRLLNERMNILSAFYLPGGKKDIIPDEISPVNYFRLIFNSFFDGDFKILDDTSNFSTKVRPYDFKDVTNRLKKAEAEKPGTD